MRIARQCKNKKLFYKTTTATISHRTQINVQQPFSNTACHCELAAKQPIFETSQSCVSTKVPLSHRFKSSPAIPGKLAAFAAAGYMMLAGHFRRNLVLSGDLNRSPESRGSQTSGVLLVLFVQAKRIKPFPFRELSRFCKPRISPLKHQLPTNKIKSFCRSAATFPPYGGVPSGTAHSVCFSVLFALQKALKKGLA